MISQAKNSTNFKKAVSFFKDYEKNKQKQQQITKSDIKKELLKTKSYKFSSKSPNADLLSKSKVLF